MDWRRTFEPQGLNWWTIVSGLGMNFMLTILLFLLLAYTATIGIHEIAYTLIMCIGGFGIPLLTAYICGRIASERFLSYAFYPLAGYLILTVPGILYVGMFGILMVIFGVLGAFNGANLAARQAYKQRHYIKDEQDNSRT
jgi:hypothetical protein